MSPHDPFCSSALERRRRRYRSHVRHLIESFAIGALRRGAAIEQFLGPVDRFGMAGVRWVTIFPHGDRFHVHLIEVQDVGHEDFFDIGEFPPLDPDDDHQGVRQIGVVDDALTAMRLAESLADAAMARWVNVGMVDAEYADYLRSRSQL
jgi:hypothetical protein